MKKDKQVSREFLRDVVEITTRISSWFGFEIISRTVDAGENAVQHISNYKEISMSRDGCGDWITVNFENKTIFLELRHYAMPDLNLNFGTMEHLNKRDQAALLALACQYGFEYDFEEVLESDFGDDDYEEEEEDEEVDSAPVVIGSEGTIQ